MIRRLSGFVCFFVLLLAHAPATAQTESPALNKRTRLKPSPQQSRFPGKSLRRSLFP